jgi:hypothetical protein
VIQVSTSSFSSRPGRSPTGSVRPIFCAGAVDPERDSDHDVRVLTRTVTTRRRLAVIVGVALTLGLGTNLVTAWVLGYYRFKPQTDNYGPAQIESIDFGADSVSIGRYRYFGSDELSWQPRGALQHSMGTRDQNNQLPPRGKPPELDRPWLAKKLPAWVPAWGRLEQLQGTDGRVEEVWALAAGWPMRSFACRFHSPELTGKPWRYVYATANGITLPGRQIREPTCIVYKMAALPLRPVWPGVVVNTAVFSLGWLPLLLVPTLRRWRRVRRRCCPACAYELGELFASGCSECGWGRAGSV